MPVISAELETAKTDLTAANASVAELKSQATIATSAAVANAKKIGELEATIVALGKKPSGNGSKLASGVKDEPGDDKPVPSYLDPNNPANKFADSRLPKKLAEAKV